MSELKKTLNVYNKVKRKISWNTKEVLGQIICK